MSGKPDKQRASAQEKALTRQAMQKDQRFESAFRPLEQEAIAELESADAGTRAALLTGRGTADVNQQAAEMSAQGRANDIASGTNVQSGASVGRGFRHSAAIAGATGAAVTDGQQQARDSIDQDTLNVIKTGQNQARSTQSALTSSARIQNSRAAGKLRAEGLRDRATSNALGQVTGAAIGGHFGAKGRANMKDDKGDYVYSDDELSGYARVMGLRKS